MDLSGNTYGRLTAISYSHRNPKNKMAFYNCVCSCGELRVVAHGALRSGSTKSCGCLAKEVAGSRTRTHGMVHTKEHKAWAHIKDRCLNKNNADYAKYGGSGLEVDPLFIDSFQEFYNHIGPAPLDVKVSVDRLDRKVGYIIGNIRWATDDQQARNRGKHSNNSSGITGVVWREDTNTQGLKFTRASAIWNSLDGKQHQKSFSVKKYGLLPAFKLAFIERAKQIETLNNLGAGYTHDHGL